MKRSWKKQIRFEKSRKHLFKGFSYQNALQHRPDYVTIRRYFATETLHVPKLYTNGDMIGRHLKASVRWKVSSYWWFWPFRDSHISAHIHTIYCKMRGSQNRTLYIRCNRKRGRHRTTCSRRGMCCGTGFAESKHHDDLNDPKLISEIDHNVKWQAKEFGCSQPTTVLHTWHLNTRTSCCTMFSIKIR